MELFYRQPYSRLGKIIMLLVAVCCHFNYSEGISTSQNTFICFVNVFDEPTASYINCTFQLNYTGELITECDESNVDGIMDINIYRKREQEKKITFAALRCVSNIAVNIHAEVAKTMDLAHFIDISRRRIFSPSLNEFQYILNVPLLQFQNINYGRWGFKGVRYQVFSTQSPKMKKVNIFISGPTDEGINVWSQRIEFCGETICRHDVSLTSLLVDKFVEIPIPSLRADPFILKEICKFEYHISRCSGLVANPPTICWPAHESEIELEYRNNTITFHGSMYQNEIPFSVLYSAFLKSENLQIIDLRNMSDQDMDKLAKSFQNQTDKPFVISNDYAVPFDEVERFTNYFGRNGIGVKEIIIGGKEDFSSTWPVGFIIRSQLLLDYGPGNYTVQFKEVDRSLVFPISIDFSPHPYRDFHYVERREYDIFAGELQSEQQLTFSCPSTAKSSDVFLKTFEEINDTFTFERDMSNYTRVFHYKNLSRRHGFQSFALATAILNTQVPNSQQLTLSCIAPRNHSWDLLITDRVEYSPLQYFPQLDRFICIEGDSNFNHWKCKNRIQCEAVAFSCLQNTTKDGFLPGGSRLSTGEDFSRRFTNSVAFKSFCMNTLNEFSNVEHCPDSIQEFHSGDIRCKTTKPTQMGILQCIEVSTEFTSESHLIYFRGFDGILYVDRDMKGPPPMEAVLKLTTTSNKNEFYTKEKYTFLCEAHSFIYDDGIWWLLKYKNGTNLKPAHELVNDGRKTESTIFKSESQLTLVLEDTALKEVICLAPYFNNLNFGNVSITIDILTSTSPTITALSTDIEFIEDATDQSLTCASSGRPMPKISWKRNNEDIKEPVRILDENTLFFPIYNFNFSGEYICTATNIAGKDTKSFFIQEKTTWNNSLIIGVVTSSLIFLSILFLIYLTNERIKKYREMREVIKLLNGKKNSTEIGDEVHGDADQTNFLFDTNYDLIRNTFIVDQRLLLGKGEFGEVYRGLLQDRNEAVAFKTVRRDAGIQHLKALVSEAKILMYIGSHDHLVTLLGVYRQEIKSGILYVAIEFCKLGSLESFLRKHHKAFTDTNISKINLNPNKSNDRTASIKKIPPEDELIKSLCTAQNLLVWSEQIANAMEYLGTKNVVHSDLATRNVLLTSEGIAKVTDFGLSRRTYCYSEYIKTAKDPLPWRWLAIESLRTNTFSTKSDVWAYGILLWEIFSLGDLPYPGMSPTLEFVQELENGLRNYKPKWASDEMYNIMERCWHLDPEQRPTFLSIRRVLNHVIADGWTRLSDEIASEKTLEDIVIRLASSEYAEI